MTLEEYRAAIERLPSMVELGKLSSILAGQVSKLMAESAGRGPVLKNMESRIADLELAVARLIGSKKPEPQFSGSPEHQTICRYISDTPALFSLLYDLNLLPEQVESNSRDETIMARITMAWRANAEVKKLPAETPEIVARLRKLVSEWSHTASGSLRYAENQGITTREILAEFGRLGRCASDLEQLLDNLAPKKDGKV